MIWTNGIFELSRGQAGRVTAIPATAVEHVSYTGMISIIYYIIISKYTTVYLICNRLILRHVD